MIGRLRHRLVLEALSTSADGGEGWRMNGKRSPPYGQPFLLPAVLKRAGVENLKLKWAIRF